MIRSKHLLLTALLAFFSFAVFAHDSAKDSTKTKLTDKGFPEKQSDNLGITLHIGSSTILGDVRANWPGLSFGLGVRKALGHAVSLRGQFIYANTYGMERDAIGGLGDEKIVMANRSINGYGNGPNYIGKQFVENYHTRYMDASIQVLYNINNLNFYKAEPRWNLYLFAAIGGNWYNTQIDALNGQSEYDFSTIDFLNLDEDQRKSELESLFDGTYDTQGHEMLLKDKDWDLNLSLGGGAGVQWKLNRRLALGLEHRYTRVANDYYDNRLYRAIFNDLQASTDFDFISFTNINLEFRLGKGQTEHESFWWTNPLAPKYDELDDIKSRVVDATTDSDDDGVPDIFDDEPNTPPGAFVDAKGRMIDSDGDGNPDHLDKEPFSEPGAKVGPDGTTLDSDGDGVPDHLDKENNTPLGTQVDRYGRAVKSMWYLPMIFFDLDKSKIKTEAFPSLKQVSSVMKMYPEMRIRVSGNTDIRASEQYNLDLAHRRAQSAIDFLVKTYGIDKSRFEIAKDGESMPLYPKARYESQHKINRRVEFIPID